MNYVYSIFPWYATDVGGGGNDYGGDSGGKINFIHTDCLSVYWYVVDYGGGSNDYGDSGGDFGGKNKLFFLND
jgi:hypothetical protein